MTKKPNKENKPKLFEDHIKEVQKTFIDQNIEDYQVSISKSGIEALYIMLNDLTTQIHELNEKMDFVMENLTPDEVILIQGNGSSVRKINLKDMAIIP